MSRPSYSFPDPLSITNSLLFEPYSVRLKTISLFHRFSSKFYCSAFLWQAFQICYVRSPHRRIQAEINPAISFGLLFAQGSQLDVISSHIGSWASLGGESRPSDPAAVERAARAEAVQHFTTVATTASATEHQKLIKQHT